MKLLQCRWSLLLVWLCLASLQGTAQQKQWKVIKVVESGISCIACLDEQRCVIGGQERQYDDTFIMQTVDGGKTWTKIYADTGIYPKRALPLHSLAWISPDVIVVSADSSYIIRSTDAGKTWTKNRVYDGYYYAKPMYFCDDRNGILFEDKNVSNEEAANRPLVTSDGGATWRLIPGPKEPVEWSQTGIRTGACIAPGKYIGYELKLIEFAISRTADYGKTWDRKFNPFSLPNGLRGYGEFFFLDSLNGWFSLPEAFDKSLYAYPTLIARTSDGGESWKVVFQDTLPMKLFGFQSMIFTDMHHGVGTSEGRICRTTDGGASWSVDSFLLDKGSTTYIAMRKQEPNIIASGVGLVAYLDEVSGVEQEPHRRETMGEVIVRNVGDYVEVEFSSKNAQGVGVWCDDVQGRRVITERVIEGGSGRRIIRLAIGDLSSGTYFITVEQGSERRTAGVQIRQ